MSLNETYKLITAPVVEPISGINWIDSHLRLDTHDEDELIEEYVKAARSYMEEIHNLMLITQIWEMNLDRFPCGEIVIRKRPVQSVQSIKYYDRDDVLQTLATNEYRVDTNAFLARVQAINSWPSTRTRYGAVTVRFTGGYGSDGSAIKPCLIQALRLHIGHLYEHRENTIEKALEKIPMGYESLVGVERVVPI